jgi:Cys-rich protein (TIGR01571 family)
MASNDAATRGRYERIDYSTTSRSVANPFTAADDHGEALDQSLLLTPETSIPAATGKALLSVVAPATLPEGYTIDVQVGGRGQLYTVKVPPGGVEEGQTFEVTIEGRAVGGGTADEEDGLHRAVALPRVSVPVGSWRDGLCDCFRFGCAHPVFWNAWCLPAILTAQVMTRMNLDVLGRPSSNNNNRTVTFRIVFLIVVIEAFLYHVARPIAFLMTNDYVTMEPDVVVAIPKEGMEGLASLFDTLFLYLRLVYMIFVVYILTVTRSFVRNKYGIPTYCCDSRSPTTSSGGVVEDCCLSFWCACCTAGQLARHTMDYDTYRGVCCSSTGVPDYVPSVV